MIGERKAAELQSPIGQSTRSHGIENLEVINISWKNGCFDFQKARTYTSYSQRYFYRSDSIKMARDAAVSTAIEKGPMQTKRYPSVTHNEEYGTSTTRIRNPKGPRIRAVEKRWYQQLQIWWIPIAQLLVTATIAASLVLLLDDYEALPDGGDYFWHITKRENFRLRISEVTTVVSASMVIVKILASCWTAVAVSGCVFILLEEPGLKINALDNMMLLGLPAVWPEGRKGWAVATVLLLLFPQPFIAPLVTGAVGWSALTGHSEQLTEVTSISRTNNVTLPRDIMEFRICDLFDPLTPVLGNHEPPPPFRTLEGPLGKRENLTRAPCRMEQVKRFDGVSDAEWAELRDWAVFLDTAVNTKLAPRKAAGLSVALWPPNEGVKQGTMDRPPCRTRVAANQPQIPVNSTTDNVDLPCILVRNINWTSVPHEDVISLTKPNDTATQARLTEYPASGAAMLFNGTSVHESIVDLVPHDYSPYQVVHYPNASTLSGRLGLLVQLYTFRKDIPANMTPPCTQQGLHNKTIFGSLQNVPDEAIFKSIFGCYAFAIVKLTAGMVNFKKASFVHPDALEGISDLPLTPAHFKPDTWVRSSMLLSEDVMMELSTANTTMIPTWDNIDGYVETLIRQSYLGSWGVLRSLQGNGTIFKVHLAESRLQAKVSRKRVLAWFVISLFVPISALVWYFGPQSTTKRNLVLNYAIAALLTDASKVLDDPQAEGLDLTNLSYVTGEDKDLRLFLAKDKGGMGKHSLSLLPPLKKKRRGKKSEKAGLMEYVEP